MDLSDVHDNWERFARERPYWAIWSVEQSADIDAFYRSGEVQVSQLLDAVEGVVDVERSAALDFGCGAGRLTRALARRFDRVVGVDISETMIDLARRNTPETNVEYVHNLAADLRQFEPETFTLIHSAITLQHMRPEYALSYIREFTRLLAAGGVAVFEIPELRARGRLRRAIGPLVDVRNRLRSRSEPVMEMHGASRSQVATAVDESGGTIVAVLSDGWYVAARSDPQASGCLIRGPRGR